jgi:hypothetical protein
MSEKQKGQKMNPINAAVDDGIFFAKSNRPPWS